MTLSKYSSKIRKIGKNPVFTADQARKAGIPSRMLSYFCEKGSIERISRGVYRGEVNRLNVHFQWEDLVISALTIPKGVICLISALCYYDLTDQIMREFWIAVPHSMRKPKRPQTRVIRMRNTQLGQITIKMGNQPLKIFDRERTVVDAFRYLSIEIAIKALQSYLHSTSQNKPNLDKLLSYAKTLRVNLEPYILALTI